MSLRSEILVGEYARHGLAEGDSHDLFHILLRTAIQQAVYLASRGCIQREMYPETAARNVEYIDRRGIL